jgi:hypothetical protein
MTVSASNFGSSEPTRSSASKQSVEVRRIRYVCETLPDDSVLRRFTQPRRSIAVEQPAELGALPAETPWPEELDELLVIVSPETVSPDLRKTIDRWLSPPEHPDALQPVVINLDGGAIRWRPGRAVITGDPDHFTTYLAALADFSFFEGELRRLERDLPRYELEAPEDVALGYQIHNVEHWDRFGRIMEQLAQLRLTFAQLEPLLLTASRSLAPEARRAISALLSRSEVRTRLEAFDHRLEACEDLYEGALDRMSDFRAYRRSEWLEILIIILLATEVIIMAWGLYSR